MSAYERSDVCAVPAASVVLENVVAFEIAAAVREIHPTQTARTGDATRAALARARQREPGGDEDVPRDRRDAERQIEPRADGIEPEDRLPVVVEVAPAHRQLRERRREIEERRHHPDPDA